MEVLLPLHKKDAPSTFSNLSNCIFSTPYISITILFSTFIQRISHVLVFSKLINSEEYLCTKKYLWFQDTMPNEKLDEPPNHIQNQHF